MEDADPLLRLKAELRAARQRRRFPGYSVFRHAFVPVFLALAIAPWIHHSDSGKTFVTTFEKTTAASTMLFYSFLVIWIAEQLYPENAEWNIRPLSNGMKSLRPLAHTFVYLFGVTQLTAFLIHAMEHYIKPAINLVRPGEPWLWPTAIPFWAKVILAFLVIELASYWVHRAAHHFKILWQFHSTHHVITELNGLKSLQTHPIDNLVFYLCRTVPLMWLGAGLDEVVAALYFGGILGILAHANINICERYFGILLNLPRAHSVHHSSVYAESQSNFGCHTVLWDRLFRTYQSTPHEPLVLGIQPIGPRSLWQELVWPFYRWVSN